MLISKVSKMPRNQYEILIKISNWTIFCFYLRSILIGIWVLLKWFFQFLWHSVQHTVTDYHSYFHEKPPPCLVDNKIGLQTYVKLKGTKLHYIEAGNQNDPLILLLHGFPDCWLGWRNQVIISIFKHVLVLWQNTPHNTSSSVFESFLFFKL